MAVQTQAASGRQRFVTVAQLAADDAIPMTEASIRWHVFNAQTNGLQVAIRRVGRRVLIDYGAFLSWIDQQSGVAA